MTDEAKPLTTRERMLTTIKHIAEAMVQNPDLPTPSTIEPSRVVWHCENAAEMVQVMRNMPNGERWRKNDPNASDYDAQYYLLDSSYQGIHLHAWMSRGNTCRRVQTGTTTVVREVTKVVSTEAVEEPVFKYECDPLLPAAQKRLDDAMVGALTA